MTWPWMFSALFPKIYTAGMFATGSKEPSNELLQELRRIRVKQPDFRIHNLDWRLQDNASVQDQFRSVRPHHNEKRRPGRPPFSTIIVTSWEEPFSSRRNWFQCCFQCIGACSWRHRQKVRWVAVRDTFSGLQPFRVPE